MGRKAIPLTSAGQVGEKDGVFRAQLYINTPASPISTPKWGRIGPTSNSKAEGSEIRLLRMPRASSRSSCCSKVTMPLAHVAKLPS